MNGWGATRRAQQATLIQRWRPWSQSTGPRTQEGKTRSRMNAYKHGLRSAAWRALKAALRDQERARKELVKCKTGRMEKRKFRSYDEHGEWSARFLK
jgi:hypothetical protein